ncbi:MAG: endonuclease III [Firmicutes bacterium]|nr:endonuclease III [Bacillota bacterium]
MGRIFTKRGVSLTQNIERGVGQLNSRIKEILRILAEEYPHAKTELHYNNPFQLLVAVILSAQTTDRQVNKVTDKLFAQVQGPADILEMGLFRLEEQLKSLGLFRQKSRQIMETSRILLEKYGGKVPDTREELESLPGIGRKSASVILSTAFGVPALAVDTHVARVSRRLGLTGGGNPFAVEEDLCLLLPPDLWTLTHHRLIAHGRKICRAKNPLCDKCALSTHCPKNIVTA